MKNFIVMLVIAALCMSSVFIDYFFLLCCTFPLDPLIFSKLSAVDPNSKGIIILI